MVDCPKADFESELGAGVEGFPKPDCPNAGAETGAAGVVEGVVDWPKGEDLAGVEGEPKADAPKAVPEETDVEDD